MVKVGNPPTAFRTRLLAALLPARRLRTGHAEDGGQHVVSQHLDQPGHRTGGAEQRGGARVDRDARKPADTGTPTARTRPETGVAFLARPEAGEAAVLARPERAVSDPAWPLSPRPASEPR